jgi:hypothetical protein
MLKGLSLPVSEFGVIPHHVGISTVAALESEPAHLLVLLFVHCLSEELQPLQQVLSTRTKVSGLHVTLSHITNKCASSILGYLKFELVSIAVSVADAVPVNLMARALMRWWAS